MSSPIIWAVVPAAGVGSRMGTNIPKQYLQLNNRCVIEHALSALLDHPLVKGVVVATALGDSLFASLPIASHHKLINVTGGNTRGESVLAGLWAIAEVGGERDWVMVHDAARPCLTTRDIDSLIQVLAPEVCGAILAQPVVETVKIRDSDGFIVATIDRQSVYLAQTPQCFGLQALKAGYTKAIAEGWCVTDEASVFELLEQRPLIVAGGRHNIKITHPEDLALASFYLQQEI